MTEKVILIGGDTPLVGVQSLPDRPLHQAPMLLFWNTGMMHRIGPNRAYVELAREAASQGYASIRFDLSGMGDSPPAHGGDTRMERVVTEVQSVMSWAEEKGHAAGFVLIGLCSGADDAHHVALADSRVRGAVCVDGYSFATPKYWRIRLAHKLLDPVGLLHSVSRRLGRRVGIKVHGGGDTTLESDFAWDMPPRNAVVNNMNMTTERGMRWLCVYTREVEDSYNYEDQFVDMLPGLQRLDYLDWRYMKEADHTLSSIADRKAFIAMVLTWLAKTFE